MHKEHFAPSFDLAELGILEKLSTLMSPATSASSSAATIRAVRYRLNVYSKGGHFKTHVDTPKSPDLVGSLVVCLPSKFTGGQLKVRCKRNETVLDWGNALSENDDGVCRIYWCAFFSDCEHEILPVQTGTRVTITYDLFKVAPVSQENVVGVQELKISALPFYRAMKAALDDPNFAPEGTTLGFFADHLYPVENFGKTPPHLKGNDLQRYAVLEALGLEIQLSCVIDLKHNVDRYVRLYKKSRGELSRPAPRDFSEVEDLWQGSSDTDIFFPEDGLSFAPDFSEFECMESSEADYLLSCRMEMRPEILWVNTNEHEYLGSAGAKYGNEPTARVWYYSIAMIVEIPSANERLSG
eukprot:TRINITY_DN15383_c0_g2_i1.p1 TRINITY_DN15383_c0_g2~~TRINITY_DN15383_c0_g2_i1.p1  ORF type:complete len:391 (+),score=91.88 TRINITY_DN15383_c0_g2_i1:112-1173(+)